MKVTTYDRIRRGQARNCFQRIAFEVARVGAQLTSRCLDPGKQTSAVSASNENDGNDDGFAIRTRLACATHWVLDKRDGLFLYDITINSEGNNTTWIVNEEGSISPLLAPGLAMGCEYAPNSRIDRILSSEQRLLGQQRAMLPSLPSRKNDTEDAVALIGLLDVLHTAIYLASSAGGVFRFVCFIFLF